MPLTSKGEKIKGAMQSHYGKEKGEAIFYASKQKGKITGVDRRSAAVKARKDDNQHMGFTKGESTPVEKLVSECDALAKRIDAFEERKAQKQPVEVKAKTMLERGPKNVTPKEPGG